MTETPFALHRRAFCNHCNKTWKHQVAIGSSADQSAAFHFPGTHVVLIQLFSVRFNEREVHNVTVCLNVAKGSQTEEVGPVELQGALRNVLAVRLRRVDEISCSRHVVVNGRVVGRQPVLQMLKGTP